MRSFKQSASPDCLKTLPLCELRASNEQSEWAVENKDHYEKEIRDIKHNLLTILEQHNT